MANRMKLFSAKVFHGRKGKINNNFTYRADYLAYPVDTNSTQLPLGLTRNGFGLWAINDRDFGDGKTSIEDYAKHLIKLGQIPHSSCSNIELLTMPNWLGYSFNPISFWLFKDNQFQLRAVVAEVTNVGRDRHSYLCKKADFTPISSKDTLSSSKTLHVSPFQNVDGQYRFNFDDSEERFAVRIGYQSPTEDGLVATLSGQFSPLTTSAILASAVRLPFGALRVMALIYWQALKLKIKGATFRHRPSPPVQELSK